ncbi:MAG: hypothetical protein R3A11_05105 [Bdellovibrionota bacterium]
MKFKSFLGPYLQTISNLTWSQTRKIFCFAGFFFFLLGTSSFESIWAKQQEWMVYVGDAPTEEMLEHSEMFPFVPKSEVKFDRLFEGTSWYKWIFNTSEIQRNLNPSIYIGPIAESDETYWNGVLIGKTGKTGEKICFHPHIPRHYLIPFFAIDKNILLIKSTKVGMYYNQFGPSNTPTIDDEEFNHHKEKKYRFLRSYLYFIIGIVIVVLGTIFLIIQLFSKRPLQSIQIGICDIFLGMHGVFYSFIPLEFFSNNLLVIKFHCSDIFLCLFFLYSWFIPTSSKKHQIQKIALFLITVFFTVGIFLQDTINKCLILYFFWYPVLAFYGILLVSEAIKNLLRKNNILVSSVMLATIAIPLVEFLILIIGINHFEISFSFMSFFLLTTVVLK